MTTDTEIHKLMHAELKACHEDFEAMRTRCASAEAALATMIEQKEYFRQCWEAAEAAPAERDRPCMWTLDEGNWYMAACENAFADMQGSYCPGCGHPVKVAE